MLGAIKRLKTGRLAPYLAWFAAAAFVFFQFFLQSASTIMSELWAHDFGLNEIELGNLSAAFFYSYIPMQIPAGVLYDMFNTKLILLCSAALLAVSSVLFAMTHNYELALIARFFMGLGAASGFVGLLKIIQNNFARNRFVLMFGIAEAIGMIGVAIGLVALAWFLEFSTWRHAMVVCGFFAALLTAGIFFFVENSNKCEVLIKRSFGDVLSQLRSVVANKQVIYCSIYGFFIVSIMNCFTSLWGEPFLSNTYQFDQKTISMLLSTVFIGLAIGSPCNGWFVERYGRHKELMLWESGLSTLVTGVIILVPGISVTGYFILFFLIGFFCSGYGPCYALVNDAVDEKIQATAVATANMFIVASAPILQVLVGAMLETHVFGLAANTVQNYRISLTILPLGYLIAFFAGFFVKPSRFTKEVL